MLGGPTSWRPHGRWAQLQLRSFSGHETRPPASAVREAIRELNGRTGRGAFLKPLFASEMRHVALLAALLPLLAPLAVLPAANAARPSAVTALSGAASGAAATKQPATAPQPPQFPESYTVSLSSMRCVRPMGVCHLQLCHYRTACGTS